MRPRSRQPTPSFLRSRVFSCEISSLRLNLRLPRGRWAKKGLEIGKRFIAGRKCPWPAGKVGMTPIHKHLWSLLFGTPECTSKQNMAMAQNRFGIPFWDRCTTHFRTYCSGDWDVHWGWVLTHGQICLYCIHSRFFSFFRR